MKIRMTWIARRARRIITVSDFARRSFPFHRTLFNAIAAQDPDTAREETLKILAIVEEDIKEMSK